MVFHAPRSIIGFPLRTYSYLPSHGYRSEITLNCYSKAIRQQDIVFIATTHAKLHCEIVIINTKLLPFGNYQYCYIYIFLNKHRQTVSVLLASSHVHMHIFYNSFRVLKYSCKSVKLLISSLANISIHSYVFILNV